MPAQTRQIMGMPITIEIVDPSASDAGEEAFAWFEAVDARFSLYRPDSEITALNAGRVDGANASPAMREVLALAARTKDQTNGYFNICRPQGDLDPSGIVKGWAIQKAAQIIRRSGARDFYVDAGGDIQSAGKNSLGAAWSIGIRNPFEPTEIVKKIAPQGLGVATSGSSARGQHIYNPHAPAEPISAIVSLTILGPDVLEADRFATAAFAMGEAGLGFIERLDGFEAYCIDAGRRAAWTSGFAAFVIP